MSVLRFEPGAKAPASTTYALVGHFGESTDFAVWCDKGEWLPLVSVAADYGPLWYVQVGEAHQGARAA